MCKLDWNRKQPPMIVCDYVRRHIGRYTRNWFLAGKLEKLIKFFHRYTYTHEFSIHGATNTLGSVKLKYIHIEFWDDKPAASVYAKTFIYIAFIIPKSSCVYVCSAAQEQAGTKCIYWNNVNWIGNCSWLLLRDIFWDLTTHVCKYIVV